MNEINIKNTVVVYAAADEISHIESILTEVNLPKEDILPHIHNFLLLKVKDKKIGTIGLEIYEKSAILRSFAVRPDHQGKGLGLLLFDKVIELAQNKNIAEIYLLTDTAEQFFKKNGFEVFPRANVPDRLKSTFEFKAPRCSEAACMRLKLQQ